jgi:hypothetical protein
VLASEAGVEIEHWASRMSARRTFARPDQGAVQFYCNGHNWLARKLTANGIGYTMADNAFVGIDDWPRAQAMADTLSPEQ